MTGVFAQVPAPELVATGGALSMLGVLMTHFLRRTKDTDELQAAAVKVRVEAADHNEQRAWDEVRRQEALVTARDSEIQTLRARLDEVDATGTRAREAVRGFQTEIAHLQEEIRSLRSQKQGPRRRNR